MAGAGSKASASSDDTVKRVRRSKPSMLDGQTMICLIDNWADFRSRYNLHGWRAGNTPEASAPSFDQKRTHACCTVAGPMPNLSPTAATVSACPKRHRDACTRSFGPGLQGSLQLVDFQQIVQRLHQPVSVVSSNTEEVLEAFVIEVV